ncbi:DNA polymerase III subunit chi [Nitrincola sp. A-D6]|uniref:DNA polymerase III subunit chi n=1 Tax=Nitrincola sp. A-D6 TaxID=1545442 RepID=UPI00051F894D|nr:DNA polymerase III subunit chi [Nitrincola sp. A-D6]KGK43066.1 DNA polymerase III subunit chi [Nitrincola sp. A-D6]
MSRRADFYILPQADEDSRAVFICRVCQKALQQGLQVHIHTDHQAKAESLDRLLWSFREDSFLPHHLIGSTPAAPISLGYGDQLPEHRQLFLNAAGLLPESAFEFERIADVVIQAPELLTSSRQNYSRCRELSYEMHRTDMRK